MNKIQDNPKPADAIAKIVMCPHDFKPSSADPCLVVCQRCFVWDVAPEPKASAAKIQEQ